jgi:hypothetical protein
MLTRIPSPTRRVWQQRGTVQTLGSEGAKLAYHPSWNLHKLFLVQIPHPDICKETEARNFRPLYCLNNELNPLGLVSYALIFVFKYSEIFEKEHESAVSETGGDGSIFSSSWVKTFCSFENISYVRNLHFL